MKTRIVIASVMLVFLAVVLILGENNSTKDGGHPPRESSGILDLVAESTPPKSAEIESGIVSSEGDEAKKFIEEFLAASTPKDRKKAFGRLLPLISNPLAAELVEQFPIGQEYDWGLGLVVEKFIKSDPVFAKSWLSGLPDSAANAYAFSVFGREYAKKNLVQAMSFLDEVDDVSKKIKYASQLLRNVQPQDFIRVVDWLDDHGRFPDGYENILIKELLSGLSKLDIENQLNYVNNQETRQRMQDLIDGMSGSDDSITARKVQDVRHEQDAHPDRQVSDFQSLAHREPVQASEFLNSLPPSPSKDTMMSLLAGQIQFRQPREAFAWAVKIQDDEIRVRTLTRVVGGHTGERLSDLIVSADISEELKRHLLQLDAAK